MNRDHLNLLYPQWQGSGQDTSAYLGALELKEYYFKDTDLKEVKVNTGQISPLQKDIRGYEDIFKQLKEARKCIQHENPISIFTIGGDCDADIAPISYLNKKADGKITILWLDAHGDLNTPESSVSKCFYGMPLRTLLGDGDKAFIDLLHPKLDPSQIVMLGVRDSDKEETEYIKKHNLSFHSSDDIENRIIEVKNTIKAKGNPNIYIHIDLDVLDPEEYPHVPVPVPGGIRSRTLLELINWTIREFKVLGIGIFEYIPLGVRPVEPIDSIIQIAKNL